jgi:hypothetical protein
LRYRGKLDDFFSPAVPEVVLSGRKSITLIRPAAVDDAADGAKICEAYVFETKHCRAVQAGFENTQTRTRWRGILPNTT